MGKENNKSGGITRREFLEITISGAVGFLLFGCRKSGQQEVTSTPRPAPERLTPTAERVIYPTPTPTEISQLVLEAEANLVDLAEKYPTLSFPDEYYPWYCLNGGEKLFDPWQIPQGTTLLIPGRNLNLLGQCQTETKEEDWQFTLAENSTSLGKSSEARLRNIRTAVSRLDGAIVGPYELFSILKKIGPFTGESKNGDEGYGQGMGYTDQGEIVMFAGGICQIPSTLFKTSAQAGMLVVQRTAHLYHWAGYGAWDATLSDAVDFTFRNLYAWPVKIEAKIKDNRLYTSIKSSQQSPYEKITIETVFDRENDDKSWDGLVKQTVLYHGRIRIREYPSHYQRKP